MSESSMFSPHQNFPPGFFPPFYTMSSSSNQEQSEQPPCKRTRTFNNESTPLIPNPNQPQNFIMHHPPNPISQNMNFPPPPPPPGPPQNSGSDLFMKTRICKPFMQGFCQYGGACRYAHGIEELRQLPRNWQSIIEMDSRDQVSTNQKCCKYSKEECPYGSKCVFPHANQNVVKSVFYKTRLCHKYGQTGSCPYGNKCQYAHGNEELKRFGGNKEDLRSNVDATTSVCVPLKQAHNPSFPVNTQPTPSMQRQQTWHEEEYEEENPVEKQLPVKWKGPNHISDIYGDWIPGLRHPS